MDQEIKIPENLLKEVLSFENKKNYVIAIFFSLIIVPFAFAVMNFINLKDCQSKPSKGCPFLDRPDTNN